MNTSRLKGSSPANPWVLGDSGQLALLRPSVPAGAGIGTKALAQLRLGAANGVAAMRKPIIFKGPPSAIIRRPPLGVISVPAGGATRSTTSIRGARENATHPTRSGSGASSATRPSTRRGTTGPTKKNSRHRDVMTPPPPVDRNAPPSRAATRIRRRWGNPPITTLGRVDGRGLAHDAHYVDDVRPDVYGTIDKLYECGICWGMKSHPVTFWLDEHSTCPECRDVFKFPPHQVLAEEKAIAAKYPDWVDHSQVTFSWSGVKFPRA
ncbi:hypothetical protein B0H15DRAFT_957798 [Mycena belliarum]|uniref:Uncharacterized protein n=1 Tax=Mycena belliarum TaxID=1033014 RepID=A0AAD6TM53_9AGAR|nr:hypothetical protein B0H15DRAFT_957798 [Mycena belliae]